MSFCLKKRSASRVLFQISKVWRNFIRNAENGLQMPAVARLDQRSNGSQLHFLAAIFRIIPLEDRNVTFPPDFSLKGERGWGGTKSQINFATGNNFQKRILRYGAGEPWFDKW